MKIIIDNREHKLIELIKKNIDTEKHSFIKFEVSQLEIGDIKITTDDDKQLLLFERKTVNDLASSILDGRYNEQSFRLDKSCFHNHNIIYIIEGSIKNYNSYTKSSITKNSLYSSLFSVLYYKGFSVYQTENVLDTSDLIIRILNKLQNEYKKGKKSAYYHNNEKSKTHMSNDKIMYESCLKTEKKSYITTDNIGKIMLMQIPGVSCNFANVIMKEYDTLINLICCLQEDINCLDSLKYVTSSGKSRKINKTCVNNIKKYLLQ